MLQISFSYFSKKFYPKTKSTKMWEYIWNITGIVGLFSFIGFAACILITGTFLGMKTGIYVIGAIFSLIIFITSTLLFPGEEEIAEEIANPLKIYQRGIENEKRGAFQRAKKDYQIVLRLDPQNKKAMDKLQLLERREIAMTFLRVAKKLMRKKKYSLAIVKLTVAKKISPPPGTLEDSNTLRNKIERELKMAKQYILESYKKEQHRK